MILSGLVFIFGMDVYIHYLMCVGSRVLGMSAYPLEYLCL